MLEVSGDQHEALIRDLAANRPKPARPHRADSPNPGPHSPTHHPQQQQQQSWGQFPEHSPFSGLSRANSDGGLRGLGPRPAAAAVAAVAGEGRSASAAHAAARLGVDLLTPRTQHHLQQQQQQQDGDGSSRHDVWFVTYHDHPDDADGMSVVGVSNSLAIDGPGPPIPAQSPELFLHSGSPLGNQEAGPAAAAAAAREHSTADLMFGLPDSLAAGSDTVAAAAMTAATAGLDVTSSPRVPASSVPPHLFSRTESHRSSSTGPGAGTHPLSSSLIRAQFRPFVRTPTLRLSRPQHSSNLSQIGSGQIGPHLGQVRSGGLGQVGSGSVPGPHSPNHQLAQGVMGGQVTGDVEAAAPSAPASGGSPRRISTSPFDNSFSSQGQGPQQQQQQQQQQHGLSSKRAQAAARSKAYLRSVSVPDPAAAMAAVALLKQQQQEQQQQQQQEGSPTPTALHPAASPHHEQEEWQQWQQSAEGLPPITVPPRGDGWDSGGGLGEGEMSTVLAALNDPETMSFVKLVSVCEGFGGPGWLGGLRLERGW